MTPIQRLEAATTIMDVELRAATRSMLDDEAFDRHMRAFNKAMQDANDALAEIKRIERVAA